MASIAFLMTLSKTCRSCRRSTLQEPQRVVEVRLDADLPRGVEAAGSRDRLAEQRVDVGRLPVDLLLAREVQDALHDGAGALGLADDALDIFPLALCAPRSAARSSFRRCAYIRTTPRGLLSSWAIPAAICPMEASFSAWIRRLWFSLRSRSRFEARR